jgi:hypothetical protein
VHSVIVYILMAQVLANDCVDLEGKICVQICDHVPYLWGPKLWRNRAILTAHIMMHLIILQSDLHY